MAAPFRYHGLDHVVLQVTAIERSLAFYCDALGLRLERIIEDAGIYQLRCGRHIVDLKVLGADTPLAPPANRGIDHVCLLVDGEMDAVLEHLARHDVEVTWGPVELYGATGFGTSVYLRDPDGHTVELKLDHAEYPLRTSARDAMAALTRPAPKPRR
ncbi:MAG: VOC family protein [Gammaproteobacteria bacterium]|jgi:glyoxylase I family protein|nr:VOC family protein [Gammaproteobacteria bacterium]